MANRSPIPAMRMTGYSDRISVPQGETIRFHVSCHGVPRYQASIVRLFSGDRHPDGAGFREQAVESTIEGTYRGREQIARAGSFAVIRSESFPGLASFTLQAWIWPTLAGRGRQVIMGRFDAPGHAGFALVLDDAGALCLEIGEGGGRVESMSTCTPLQDRQWYRVSATFDAASGRATLIQTPRDTDRGVFEVRETRVFATRPAPLPAVPFMVAACGGEDAGGTASASAFFNGKIDSPRVCDRPLEPERISQLTDAAREPLRFVDDGLVAAWDFSREISSTRIVDASPGRHHGVVINFPARGMTGQNWNGSEYRWTHAPGQYGAIHFHEDDIYDAGWSPDFEFAVPATLESGVYAARLSANDEVDYIPFVVRPSRDRPAAPMALLLPTASYLAYANEHAGVDAASTEVLSGHITSFGAGDLYLNEHRELGYSMYDTHADGSGVCYSSRLRPILNMRPGVTASWIGAGGSIPWQFNADLHLVEWLAREGFDCDVITDEDLDAEGLSLLDRYSTVMTGTHPEYWSTPMYDALSAWLGRGGRLMYMGGNGFYWRIAWHRECPGIIELRRAEDGIRDWVAEPGEYHHSFTGELGGLWRRIGRAPQALVGVGMAVQGFDVCGHYVRTPASHDPRVAFAFAGVSEDVIGDFGTVGGGAAGLELDRADFSLGTPPHTLVVARSAGLTSLYFPPPEEVNNITADLDSTQNPQARGDMTFFETPSGGAVFSFSSIAWAGSLSWNERDNNVSRITGNVLRRFLDPAPFRMPDTG